MDPTTIPAVFRLCFDEDYPVPERDPHERRPSAERSRAAARHFPPHRCRRCGLGHPAVLFAGAAPALAASPVIIGGLGRFCKYPGNSVADCPKNYRAETTWTSTAPVDVTVSFSFAASWDSGASLIRVIVDGTPLADGVTDVTIPAGATVAIVLIASSNNSANTGGTLNITGSYTYNGNAYTHTITETFASTPPCTADDPDCYN